MSAEVEFYMDEAGEYRWRVRDGNGEIVIPPEGHTREDDARRAFENACEALDEVRAA